MNVKRENSKEPYNIFRIASKPYGFEILSNLYKNPKRFTDLKEVCPNDKTLTLRLNEFKKVKLVKTTINKYKEREFIHYNITELGKKIIQSVENYYNK